ncbi:MAG: penicillin-binding protein 2 [Acidimicrobiia bacterium]
MNRAIRKVGIAVSALILVLVVQLTYLQVVDADNLANDPGNVRNTLRDFNRPRGNIVTADGAIVATSVKTAGSGDFKFQRTYPLGDLFSQISGVQTFQRGNTGVEASYNDALTGRDTGIRLDNLGGIFSGNADTGNVVLSLSQAAQQAARDALEGQRGSVVVVNVRTGEIVAMFSNPTFDPNPLAGHDALAVDAAFNALGNDPAKPDLPRAYREIYPPGSSFKIITSAGALDTGLATPTEPVYPFVSSIPLPNSGGQQLSNFGGETCGGNLTESLVHSCNTTFGQIGLDLGNALVPAINNCGVGVGAPPIDLSPGAVGSLGPTRPFADDQPGYAKAAIGQQDVAVTPLEMALAAAGIANNGVIMEPRVAHEIQNADGSVAKTIESRPWKTCITPQNARVLTDMMVQVVQRGTGTAARIPGVTVAGKTGTAQTGSDVVHAWFVAFAPAEAPQFAVSVILEGGGFLGNEATGGQVAAPIAKRMLEVVLGV